MSPVIAKNRLDIDAFIVREIRRNDNARRVRSFLAGKRPVVVIPRLSLKLRIAFSAGKNLRIEHRGGTKNSVIPNVIMIIGITKSKYGHEPALFS